MIQDVLLHPGSNLRADVCICGAGPAGIVLALELAQRRPDWHIVLLEAGGKGAESERERELYQVQTGEKSYAVEASRRRMFGGTSVHWGGWCKPLDASDFSAPASWSSPDWPFGPEELQPHMPAAHAWCEINSDQYDMGAIRSAQPQRFLDLPADGAVAESLFRFSPPTRFGSRYAEQIRAQANLTCLLHANVQTLQRQGDRIVSLSATALGGNPFTVQADRFVLAQGGLENTRTLLNLRGDASDDGLGLCSPHLGRHFADHYGIRPGLILAPAELGYLRFSHEGSAVMPVLTPAPALLASGQAQNICLMLEPLLEPDSLPEGYAGQAALGFLPGEYWNYRVQMITEPRPHPDSRITLSDKRCELGLRRARLDWHLDPTDTDLALAFFKTFGATLAASGQGRVRLTYENTPEQRALANGANHHMGTTRFSRDPRDGVTDPDGRVHDLDNLYVTGSSLFPRYGYANPTLTIVALAVRLAARWAGPTQEANS